MTLSDMKVLATEELKNIIFYSVLTFTAIRVVKLIYIFAHNIIEQQQWPYIKLAFGGNPEINFNFVLSSLILAPILETLFLYLFFIKRFKFPKCQIIAFSIFFALYHYFSMGLYGALYTFIAGLILAFQYHNNLIASNKEVAIRRGILTHSLVNSLSAFA